MSKRTSSNFVPATTLKPPALLTHLRHWRKWKANLGGRAPHVADVGDRRPAILRRARHAPTHYLVICARDSHCRRARNANDVRASAASTRVGRCSNLNQPASVTPWRPMSPFTTLLSKDFATSRIRSSERKRPHRDLRSPGRGNRNCVLVEYAQGGQPPRSNTARLHGGRNGKDSGEGRLRPKRKSTNHRVVS